MLKKFSVKGFKNFASLYSIDFTDVRDYKFNQKCIKNGLLNNIIIYGKNATGKSNIGLAIFDIVSHLTEKNITPHVYDNYLNKDIKTEYAEFQYIFEFNGVEIEYTYRKVNKDTLIYEELKMDSKLVLEYDFTKNKKFFNIIDSTRNLNFENFDADISILRYIVNNSIGGEIVILKHLITFVSNMLWTRNLEENRYIGNKNNTKDFFNFLSDDEFYFNEFSDLLKEAGINEKLSFVKSELGEPVLCFKKIEPIPFFKAASNGTKALYVLFYWLKTANEISFFFIDEFDAYYHHELSEFIVNKLADCASFQTVLTSHNTNLLTNRIMRPDCYFILTGKKITSIADATERELREGHNLQKLYISGEFDA